MLRIDLVRGSDLGWIRFGAQTAVGAQCGTILTRGTRRQGEQARARVEKARLDLAESKRAIACLFAEKGNLKEAQVSSAHACTAQTRLPSRPMPCASNARTCCKRALVSYLTIEARGRTGTSRR